MPRIIAGKCKGLILKAPKGRLTRPTIDRTKEALFSMILPFLQEAVVLDLFSGTGSLGLEALSRGARFAYLNDRGRDSVAIIKENTAKCGLQDLCKVTCLDYKRAVESLPEKVDVVFLDPPYEKDFIEQSIELLLLNDIINVNGLIICEHGKNEIMKNDYPGISLKKQKRYGIATISIYKKEV